MNMKIVNINLVLVGMLLICFTTAPLFAANNNVKRNRYEDQGLIVRASTRKPDQLDAFYTGRGFLRSAITEIKKTCFVTVLVKNKAYDVLWLNLDDWIFFDHMGKHISRISSQQWIDKWLSIGLKQAHQSTFRWTQLPSLRDLRADEHAAGNIAFPWQDGPIKLVAKFKTGLNQKGGIKTVTLENIQCTK